MYTVYILDVKVNWNWIEDQGTHIYDTLQTSLLVWLTYLLIPIRPKQHKPRNLPYYAIEHSTTTSTKKHNQQTLPWRR